MATSTVVDTKPKTLYHGSANRIEKLLPRESRLTDKPAVFASSSYDDAVIFSAQWTDYDFLMWRSPSGTTVYIEEQYPGAAIKLNKIGYIHHIDSSCFRLLQCGLGNEYICDDGVTPIECDKVNIAEYINGAKGIVLRTFDEALLARKQAKIQEINGEVACIITADVLASSSLQKQLHELATTSGCHLNNIENMMLDKLPLGRHILVGDSVLGNERWKTNAPMYYVKQDRNELIDGFKSTKTTLDEFKKYLASRSMMFPEHVTITSSQLNEKLLTGKSSN